MRAVAEEVMRYSECSVNILAALSYSASTHAMRASRYINILLYTKSRDDVVDVSPPLACHGGTRGSMFGLQRMQNSTVNARDSRFFLVRTLDR